MQIKTTTSPTYEQAAEFKVDRAFADPACERLDLFVIPDKPGDPLPDGMTAAEVSFSRAQRAEAVIWAAAALRARWIVFRAGTDGR